MSVYGRKGGPVQVDGFFGPEGRLYGQRVISGNVRCCAVHGVGCIVGRISLICRGACTGEQNNSRILQ